MSDKYTQLTVDISTQLAKFRKEIPEVMAGFAALTDLTDKVELQVMERRVVGRDLRWLARIVR